jgi:hypothetical protein
MTSCVKKLHRGLFLVGRTWSVLAVFAVLLSCTAGSFQGSVLAQNIQEKVRAVDTVIFDNSREQLWLPYDVGFFGYSELAISLRQAGFLVTESNLPVTYSLAIDPQGSVLVMGPALGQKYTDKEIQAIEKYVTDGGGLLILADPEGEGGDSFQNTLSSAFGIAFMSRPVVDEANSATGTAGQWIIADSKFFGIDSVSLPVATALLGTASATVLLSASDTATPPRALLAAAAESGKGRVACIGDSQFLINGGKAEIGIGCGRNREFALALFNWLAGRDKSPSCRIVPQYTLMSGSNVRFTVRVEGRTNLSTRASGARITPEKVENATGELTFKVEIEADGYVEFVGSDGVRKTVILFTTPTGGIGARAIFDLRGYGPDIADPINGYLQFARQLRDKGFWVWAVEEGLIDLKFAYGVIIVNPLGEDGHIYLGDTTRPSLRWVFINDPYSTIQVHNPLGQWFRDNGFADRQVPIHAMTEQFEAGFLPYTVFEPDISATLGRHHTFPILEFGVEKCNSFRCAPVEAIGGTPILLGSIGSWALEGCLGLRPELTGVFPTEHDRSTRAIVGALSLSGTAVLIGDAQIFAEQHIMNRGNWTLAWRLADWMAGKELEMPGQ